MDVVGAVKWRNVERTPFAAPRTAHVSAAVSPARCLPGAHLESNCCVESAFVLPSRARRAMERNDEALEVAA